MQFKYLLLLLAILLLFCNSCLFDSNDEEKEHFLKGKVTDIDGNSLINAGIYIVFDEDWNTKGINDSLPGLMNFWVCQYQNSSLDWNDVIAGWDTYTESNMQGFYLFRGTTEYLDSAIAVSPLIPATNTSEYHLYNYIDNNVPDGFYYYWLKAVELDNMSYYIGPYSINVHQYQPPASWSFYACPNPFSAETWFCFEAPDTCSLKIDITSPYLGLVEILQQDMPYPWSGMHRWNGFSSTPSSHIVCNGLYQARLTATSAGGATLFSKTINILKNTQDIDSSPVAYSSDSGYSIPYKDYFQFGKQFEAYDSEAWAYSGSYQMPTGFTVHVKKEGYETASKHIDITNYNSDRTEDFILESAGK